MTQDVPDVTSSGGKRFAAIAILVLPALLLFAFHPDLNRARQVGGVDEGRLFLAGATAILQGSDFPLTQRTPLYSLLLAAVGRAAGVQPDVLTHGAREYGSIEDADVAEGFVKPRFQKMMLWVQAGLWLLSVLILYRTAVSLDLPFAWTFGILAVYVPLTWLLATYIYDPVLTQFLLALGFYALVRWYRMTDSTGWILLSAISFSLSALSRPTFQLLVPCLMILVWIVLRMATGVRPPAKAMVIMISVWLLIVGGYSLRNYVRNGFFGVSCAYGLSLTGRAAPFLEKAQDKFPDEVAQFLKIRDVDGRGMLWGARGIKWLMTERNMTWPEANRFMARVSTTAILRAPVRYLIEVGKSLVTFHVPYALRCPRYIALVLYAIDLAATAAFMVAACLWASFHLLRWTSRLAPQGCWSVVDSVILSAILIYWYCAAISCGIDAGKPEHRYVVFFLMPLVIALAATRLEVTPLRFLRRNAKQPA